MHRRSPRPDRRAARRAVLSTIMWLLLAQFGGSLLVDWCPEDIRFPELGGLMHVRETAAPAPDLVLFGSSRLMGVSASQLQRSFAEERRGSMPAILNASVPAGDPLASDRMLEHLLAHAVPAPRAAVIEISPELLTRRNRWLRFAILRFFRWSDVLRVSRDLVPSRALNTALGSRLNPWFTHRQNLRIWLTRVSTLAPARADPAPPGGYTLDLDLGPPPPLAPEAIERSRQAVPHFRGWLRDYQIAGAASDGLIRFLERCRAAGIAAVILAVPATSYYRTIYTAEVERPFQAHMTALVRAYGARFVDYRSRLDDRLFSDAYHLRPEGGKVLADLLVREVLAPLWPPAGADRSTNGRGAPRANVGSPIRVPGPQRPGTRTWRRPGPERPMCKRSDQPLRLVRSLGHVSQVSGQGWTQREVAHAIEVARAGGDPGSQLRARRAQLGVARRLQTLPQPLRIAITTSSFSTPDPSYGDVDDHCGHEPRHPDYRQQRNFDRKEIPFRPIHHDVLSDINHDSGANAAKHQQTGHPPRLPSQHHDYESNREHDSRRTCHESD
jgi:hypothetical protein